MGSVKKEEKKEQGEEPRAGRVPRNRVVLSGDLEKGKYLLASFSAKTARQGWLVLSAASEDGNGF